MVKIDKFRPPPNFECVLELEIKYCHRVQLNGCMKYNCGMFTFSASIIAITTSNTRYRTRLTRSNRPRHIYHILQDVIVLKHWQGLAPQI